MFKFIKRRILKGKLIKLIRQHKLLEKAGEIANNEKLQTELKTRLVKLGSKRFWEN